MTRPIETDGTHVAKRNVWTIAGWLTLAAMAVLSLLPIYWMALSSACVSACKFDPLRRGIGVRPCG